MLFRIKYQENSFRISQYSNWVNSVTINLHTTASTDIKTPLNEQKYHLKIANLILTSTIIAVKTRESYE